MCDIVVCCHSQLHSQGIAINDDVVFRICPRPLRPPMAAAPAQTHALLPRVLSSLKTALVRLRS